MNQTCVPWRLAAAVLVLMSLLLVSVNPAAAQDPDEASALMQPPAPDAAFVAQMEGFQTITTDGLVRKLALQEGLVIRQSYVEDGKVIIPPSGLYYTTRMPTIKALQGDKLMLLGKVYSFVDYGTRFDVLKDVDFKLGDCAPIGDGTKCFEMSSIGYSYAGEIPTATFQILKPSGNYYGNSFPVTASDLVVGDDTLRGGTDNTAGSLLPGEVTNWHNTYYDLPVATSGQTYVVVDEVTDFGAHLVDAGTGAINWLWMTEQEPVEMVLGADESMELGEFTVQVVAIDPEAKTADVQILDGSGEVVAEKTFGPLVDELYNFLPEDELARTQLTLSSGDDVYIHWDIFREPFQEDKVALVGYTDLIKVENPGEFWLDDRFIVRPDT